MPAKLLPTNQHPIERLIRVALGLGLLAVAFVGPKTPWGYLGVIPLATGLLGSCPLYALFGFSTCPVRTH
jgi:Inner membrane protein YgaP-like, transmembrane domain